jgi:hypothetical protein
MGERATATNDLFDVVRDFIAVEACGMKRSAQNEKYAKTCPAPDIHSSLRVIF